MTWPMPGLSLRWYQEFLADRQLLQALRNSLVVAFWSTLIGLVIGIPAAIAIDRYAFPGRVVFQRLVLLPFVLPGILMGLALLTLFLNVGHRAFLGTVIAGHATLLVAVVIAETSVGLRRWDRTIEQAAMDLGANEWQTFFYVMLPNLRTVIGGAVLLGSNPLARRDHPHLLPHWHAEHLPALHLVDDAAGAHARDQRGCLVDLRGLGARDHRLVAVDAGVRERA